MDIRRERLAVRRSVGLLPPMYLPSEERYLERFGGEQLAAVASKAHRLGIIAPAGAGKSTTIAARARVLQSRVGVDSVLALCFGRDAAKSLQIKLNKVCNGQARAMTIHSLALKVIRWASEAGDDHKVRLVSVDGSEGDHELNRELRSALGRWVKSAKGKYPADGMTVARAKAAVARIESGGRAANQSERMVWSNLRRWFAHKSDDWETVTDYGYAVIWATNLIRAERERLAAGKVIGQRDSLLGLRDVIVPETVTWLPDYDAVIVDEAQDVNPHQVKLIEALDAEWLTAVGDSLQGIYGFQGADSGWLESMPAQVHLRHDYRSTKAIVRVAAAVAGNGMVAADDAANGDPVRLYHANTETDEDKWIGDEIEALLAAGLPPIAQDDRGIAVLTREAERGQRLREYLRGRLTAVTTKAKQDKSRRWRLWRRVLPGCWRTTEITRNPKTGKYHPHMHVLMMSTNLYGRYYQTDKPSAEGITWVRKDNGRMGSPYYRTGEQWAEEWTRDVLQAQGANTNGLTVTDDKDGYKVSAPGVTGSYFVDIRQATPDNKALQELTKYVTKDIEMLPPGLDDTESAARLMTLSDALEGYKPHVSTGVIKTIIDKANAGTLRDQMADNPVEAEPLDMDELIRRYLVAQGQEAGWVVDGKSYARWADGHYAKDHWESVGDDVPEDYDPFADGEDE